MVLQKRLYYGFNGYQGPPMPRGSRSARGRRSFPKKDENPMFAFEMLAMVAGKLLVEKEIPARSSHVSGCVKQQNGTIKQEIQSDEKVLKLEPGGQGSYNDSTLAVEKYQERIFGNFKLKECHRDSNTLIQQPAILKAEELTRMPTELKFPVFNSCNDVKSDSENCSGQTYSPGSDESHVTKIEDGAAVSQMTNHKIATNGVDDALNLFCMEDPMILDPKVPMIDSSDSSVEAPLNVTYIPRNQFPTNSRACVEIVDRDDDENSSRCTLPSTIFSKSFGSHDSKHPVDRKIRKMLASKFWKVGPTLLKDGESSNNDTQAKPIFHSRRMCYTRQRSQRSSLKSRRQLGHGPLPTSDGGLGNGASSKLVDVDSKKEARFPLTTSSEDFQQDCKSEDCQVKFSVKSIKVPEILIEMPETATVGALKRAILETLTAILHDGIRVGTILQGKKVKDDSKTLQQAGFLDGVKTDSLGFYLEPKRSRARPHLAESDELNLPQHNDSTKTLSRLPVGDPHLQSSTDNFPETHKGCLGNYTHNTDKPVPELSATSITLLDDDDTSRALVPIPAMSTDAMAVVPFQRKSRRSELVQRRIRRPFSVTEVEALVQAVEVLGTGRWRDVKLRAFEDAKHRTYVDLKDKWKTLVHTARISPQQRRGEPVPQELLDRVLVAHAYWSHQQAKLQVKQQPEQALLL